MTMEIRRLSDSFSVSPQIDPEDVIAIKEAGFGAIICNRPDIEIPSTHHASVIQTAAEAAGLQFVEFPITHQTLTVDAAKAQRDIMDQFDVPIFAYCASGTRSTIVWALTQAKDCSSEQIITAAAGAGYDVAGMRTTLDDLHAG